VAYLPAAATIGDVLGDVRLAPVVASVAIGEAVSAGDLAHRIGAIGCAVERGTPFAAPPTVLFVGTRVRLAAVLGIAVAIFEWRLAGGDHARAPRALGGGVRQAARHAASAAVLGGGLQVRFAAVAHVAVAVALALQAHHSAHSTGAGSARAVVGPDAPL